MSKESYARGFCKVAEAAGVDPVALIKFSQAGIMRDGPTVANANFYDSLQRGLRPNNPYSTPSKPKSVTRLRPIDAVRGSGLKPDGEGLFKRIFPRPGSSVGSRVGRVASNVGTGVLNSIFPGLGTGMNRLSSGIAGRIKSLLPR